MFRPICLPVTLILGLTRLRVAVHTGKPRGVPSAVTPARPHRQTWKHEQDRIGCLAGPYTGFNDGGGQGPIFDDGGGARLQVSKFLQNHKGPPYVKIGTSDFGGGGMAPLPPCIRAWCLLLTLTDELGLETPPLRPSSSSKQGTIPSGQGTIPSGQGAIIIIAMHGVLRLHSLIWAKRDTPTWPHFSSNSFTWGTLRRWGSFGS